MALMLIVGLFAVSGCGTVSAIKGLFVSAPHVVPDNPSLVKGVLDHFVWAFWIGGILAIAGGVASIIYLPGQQLHGIALILCGIIAPIFMTWFSFHYISIIACAIIGFCSWYLLTHAAARSAVIGETESIAKTAAAEIQSLQKKI